MQSNNAAMGWGVLRKLAYMTELQGDKLTGDRQPELIPRRLPLECGDTLHTRFGS